MNNNRDPRLAVLIDADNVPYSNIKGILEEIAKYGTPTFKRIYADWTQPTVAGWKKVLLENAITPFQQYSYTTGKNSTDSALIIDAMDILYTGRVDGFCIVSSDSDFTKLAIRLREAGMKVYGFGEKKTPKSLISACDKFVYIEILKKDEKVEEKVEEAPRINIQRKSPEKPKAPKIMKEESVEELLNKELRKLIANSINDVADDEGWAFLGELGNLILKKQPDFDPRNFGFKKLLPMIKSFPQFVIDERETGNKNVIHVFVRNK